MIDVAKKGVVYGSALALSFIALAVLSFRFGPAIEVFVNPPLIDVQAVLMEETPEASTVFLKATKNRPCNFVSGKATVEVQGELITTGRVQIKKADGQVVEPGQQREGSGTNFIRILHVTPGSEHITLYPEYECHPFWHIQQRIRVLDRK